MSITDYQIAGIIVTIITSLWIWFFVDEETFEFYSVTESKKIRIGSITIIPKFVFKGIYLVILHLAVMFCISTVGGITDAKWITSVPIWDNREDFIWIEYVMGILFSLGIHLFPMLLTFVVGYFVMGLIKFETSYSPIIFLLTFLISVFGWCYAINGYNANIEYTTEVYQETCERELIFFYGVPMQEISDFIQETPDEESKTVFAADEVPYVYLNEEGNGEWDFVPAEDSEIIFITEAEKPKIVIVTNISKEIKIDHNDGTSSVTDESYWIQYYFYLPRTIIQPFENVGD